MITRTLILTLLLSLSVSHNSLAQQYPYKPDKVVYDVSSANTRELNHLLDRMSMLQKVYGNDSFESSIIIVLHEGAIPLFASSGKNSNPELIRRAHSLTMGDVIKFRLCSASAKIQGFSKKHFHDFITLVPMADAEIVQLQRQGYAYLR